MKKTLVIGASENPERYSYKAITALVKHGHAVKALGVKTGNVSSVEFDVEKIPYEGIDTITLYVGAKNQVEYFDYIKELNPKRVLFNPGTENPAFEQQLTQLGINVERACTLVLLASNQY